MKAPATAAGFAAALGITSGVLVWAVAAAVGVSALLAASHTAYTVLRVAGALYMVYLGVRLVVAALRRPMPGGSAALAPFDRGAGVHHHGQARCFGPLERGVVDDAQLEPDPAGTDRDGLVDEASG